MGIESEQSAVEAPDVKREKAKAAATLARKRKTAAARRQRSGKAAEPVVEDKPGTVTEAFSELKDSFVHVVPRLKETGLEPFKEAASKTARRIFLAINNFLDDLDGKKGGK